MKKIIDAYYKVRDLIFNIQKDKLIHFILGIIVGAIALVITKNQELIFVVSFFTLLSIECFQKAYSAGKFELLDLVAGLMGVLFLYFVLLFI